MSLSDFGIWLSGAFIGGLFVALMTQVLDDVRCPYCGRWRR